MTETLEVNGSQTVHQLKVGEAVGCTWDANECECRMSRIGSSSTRPEQPYKLQVVRLVLAAAPFFAAHGHWACLAS